MKKSLSIFFLLFSIVAFASHDRAGEILYKRIAPTTTVVSGVTVQLYTYSITVIRYTDHSYPGHIVADKCVDTLYFGDGQKVAITRGNGGNTICQDCPYCGVLVIDEDSYKVKYNTYSTIHKYGSTGSYLLHSSDADRNAGIQNIPNSDSQEFYIESLLVISEFSGANSLPEFTNLPIDRACYGKCFYHNPGAYDPDGDSLSYAITQSRGADGQPIPGYSMPNATGGVYNINALTGLITWCTPQSQGEYNLAFIVTEWRKNTSGHYYIIGTVLRDMQVVVGTCPDNNPPIVFVPQDTCVEAGSAISKYITFGDPNVVSTITLQGSGGAFSALAPNATLSNTVFATSSSHTTSPASFFWQTSCDHIRQQPYQTTFKAQDDGLPAVNAADPISLVYFASYNIKVVPPSVKNVTATPQGSAINLTWSLSACNPINNPIVSYQVYRKNDCTPFLYQPCQTGVPAGSGFSNIGETASNIASFLDNNNGNGLTVGQDYGYLVIAVYSDGSQSMAGSQVCAKLRRDIPLLLNVDVLSTSTTSGSVYVRWERPLTNIGNLDTIMFPGPYQFNLKYRAGSSGVLNTIYNSSSPYFLALDTQYTHNNINTGATSAEYEVEFVANTTTVGSSQRASSIFLTATPGDRHINLQWTSTTPWNNYKYTVYRKDPLTATFYTIATTTNTNYNDTVNIANRFTYCYKILGEGQYSDPSIYKPLLNNSQEVCAKAVDLTPPCAPTLSITADCPTGIVQISWTNVKIRCSDDVLYYNLFYKPTVDDKYVQVTQVGWNDTTFTYDGLELISGCYAIQSVDSSNNVSPFSPDFCIDNCPLFDLPNIVTFNGDGVNDFFKAIRVRQIKEIDLVIFDRWGNLVYKTKDPYFKWDGTSLQSKQIVSEGTFFYICDVFEPRLKGIVKRNLKGYVQVIK